MDQVLNSPIYAACLVYWWVLRSIFSPSSCLRWKAEEKSKKQSGFVYEILGLSYSEKYCTPEPVETGHLLSHIFFFFCFPQIVYSLLHKTMEVLRVVSFRRLAALMKTQLSWYCLIATQEHRCKNHLVSTSLLWTCGKIFSEFHQVSSKCVFQWDTKRPKSTLLENTTEY